MKQLLLSFALLFTINVCSQTISGKLIRVLDGDTVIFQDSTTRTQITVRLFGIDCPEKGQDYYNKAIDFVKRITEGRSIRVEVTGEDAYERVLGYLYADDINVNHELLKEGLAWYYKHSDFEEMVGMEADAKHRKYNIWSMRAPIAPWDYGRPKPKEEKGIQIIVGRTFYICKSSPKMYHLDKKCPELHKCKSEISEFYRNPDSGMYPCTFCIHNEKGQLDMFLKYNGYNQ